MTSPQDDFQNRRSEALNDCQASMKWFAKTKRIAKNRYYAAQAATIILSALTPVLILITDLPKWAQALPAALAAITASLSSVYNWKENWVRLASILELLYAENTRYKTRTTSAYDVSLDDQQALSNFVQNVTDLNLMEASEWRSLHTKQIEQKK